MMTINGTTLHPLSFDKKSPLKSEGVFHHSPECLRCFFNVNLLEKNEP